MDYQRVVGFKPFYDDNSIVLILGSFPSVKSRQTDFYYGNKQNAFWKIIAKFFGESVPVDLDEKQSLLTRHKIALWDVVESCTIVGSSDATIKDYSVIDLPTFLSATNIKTVLINGGKAKEIYKKQFGELDIKTFFLPSTSPANTRRNDEEWYDALRTAFDGT